MLQDLLSLLPSWVASCVTPSQILETISYTKVVVIEQGPNPEANLTNNPYPQIQARQKLFQTLRDLNPCIVSCSNKRAPSTGTYVVYILHTSQI
jgi:hypothetical protein